MSREINGVKVRALTRDEIDSLKMYGFNWSFFDPPGELSGQEYDEGMQKAFDLSIQNPEAFKKLSKEGLNKTTQVWTAILLETYGSKAEEKNLPSSGNGGQTEKE